MDVVDPETLSLEILSQENISSVFLSQEKEISQQKSQSEPFKKVEFIVKKLENVDKVEKSVTEIMDMLKQNQISIKYLEEEIIVNVKLVDSSIRKKMLIDSGAPLSIVSSNWLKNYIEEVKVDENIINYRNCIRRLRLVKNTKYQYF